MVQVQQFPFPSSKLPGSLIPLIRAPLSHKYTRGIFPNPSFPVNRCRSFHHRAGLAPHPHHVECPDTLAGGGQEGGHLVLAPRAVHQHEVVLVLLRRSLAALRRFFCFSCQQPRHMEMQELLLSGDDGETLMVSVLKFFFAMTNDQWRDPCELISLMSSVLVTTY